MYNIWKQRENSSTITQAILRLSGMTELELTNPSDIDPNKIENMEAAAAAILSAVINNEKITVFGDYDADGTCATAILFLLLRYLDVTPRIRMPKRMSEGYGISVKAVDEISEGLLITVDNGIAAIEAIQKAREKGLSVIVIDHHLPGDKLPNANIIVDPHVCRENNAFSDFCGAGLAYELARLIVPGDSPLLSKLVAIAAVATVADVVPLTGANRAIVKAGLEAMNKRVVTQGMRSLIDICRFTVIKEDDIGFKLAPILNAAGRLIDDGARVSCGCLAQDEKLIPATAKSLLEVNDTRKQMVADSYASVLAELLAQFNSEVKAPIVVHQKYLHEGIVGIVAGRLAEEFKMPAFVFTGDGDTLKGSGRSFGGVHLKELVDTASDHLEQYGGHAGAVGLSIKKDNISNFRDALQTQMKSVAIESSDTLFYDVSIFQKDVLSSIEELKLYAPYGERNPKPVVLIQNLELFPYYGSYVKYMGKSNEHIKLTAFGFSLVGFSLSEQYKRLGEPKKIDVIGRLGINDSVYGSHPQIEIIDFRPAI